ncbi:unnamed protein product [Calypogeia fissa]
MAARASGALLILRRAFASAAESSSITTAAVAKPPGSGTRRRKKNLVEVAQFLPNWGVGAKLAKGHWQRGTFYQLTRLQLGKDARHGDAWGVFHDSGAAKTGTEEKIGGVNKRVWKYLNEDDRTRKKP